MGVHGLWELLSPVGVRVSNDHVRGKVLAVDVSIWLTQFIKAMRDAEGAQVRNGHLLGVFRRCIKLLFLSVRPVLIFDGATPALKRRTLSSRQKIREKHTAKLRRLAEKLLVNQIRKRAVEEAIEAQTQTQRKRGKERRPVQAVDSTGTDSGSEDEITPVNSVRGRNKSGKASRRKVRWADGHERSDDKNEEAEDEDKIEPVHPTARQSQAVSGAQVQRDRNGERKDVNQDGFYADDIADEEEALIRDRSSEPIALPQDLDDIDDEALIDLPPGMQSEIFKQFKLQQRAKHRERMMTKQGDPAEFSRTQIEGFLQNTALNRKLKSVRNAINSKSGPSQRIASDSGRQYILEEIHSGKKVDTEESDFDSDEDDYFSRNGVSSLKKKGGSGSSDILARLRANRDVAERKFEAKKERERRLKREDQEMRTGVGWASKVLEGRGGLTLGGRSALGAPSETAPMISESSDSDESMESGDLDQSANKEGTTGEGKDSEKEADKDDDDDSVEWEDGNDTSAPDFSFPTLNMNLNMYVNRDDDAAVPSKDAEPVAGANIRSPSPSRRRLPDDFKASKDLSPSLDAIPKATHDITKTQETGIVKPHIENSGHEEEGLLPLTENREQMKSSAEEKNIVESVDGKIRSIPKEIYSTAQHKRAMESAPPKPIPDTVETTSTERQSPNSDQGERIEGESHKTSTHAAMHDDPKDIKVTSDEDDVVEAKTQDQAGSMKRGDTEEEEELQMAIALSLRESKSRSAELGVVFNELPSDKDTVVVSEEPAPGKDSRIEPDSPENGQILRSGAEPPGEGSLQVEKQPRELTKADSDAKEDEEDSRNPEEDGMSTERMRELRDELEIEALQIQKEKVSQQGAAESVSDEMYSETRDLLKLFGIPYLEAPTEAEAQCAFLDMAGVVDGVITEDSDAFLFGARTVYRRLFSEGYFAEAYDVHDIKTGLGLEREGLIRLAYLLGSDYTPGVRGVGVVNSMEILEAFPGEKGLEEFYEWTKKVTVLDEEPGEEIMKSTSQDAVRRIFCWKHRNMKRNWEIRDGFPNPAVADAYWKPEIDPSKDRFKWGAVNFGALERFCWEKFGWEKDAFEAAMGPLRKKLAESAGPQQRRIDEFFKPHRFAKIKSQRLQSAVKGMAGEQADGLMAEIVPRIPKRKRLPISHAPVSDSDEEDGELVKAVEKIEEERSRSEQEDEVNGNNQSELEPERVRRPQRSSRRKPRKRQAL